MKVTATDDNNVNAFISSPTANHVLPTPQTSTMLTSPSSRPADVPCFVGVPSHLPHTTRTLPHPPPESNAASSSNGSQLPPKVRGSKRKDPGLTALPRDVKRLRPAPKRQRSEDAPYRGSGGSERSSRAGSPAAEPVYRGNRSRSGSAFPRPADGREPPREWWIEEDGAPGEGFLSAEEVVKDLMKTYKACKSWS